MPASSQSLAATTQPWIDRIEIEVDVSDAVGSPDQGPLLIRAWVFLPPLSEREITTVMFCAPGGTFSKAYYHLTVPGRSGYSFAQYVAARGHIVVAFDYLGVGDSMRPADIDTYTSSRLTKANHALAVEIIDRLRRGTLDARGGPSDHIFRIGVGHSMGAFLTVRQQSLHGSFDAVAPLGWGLHIDEGILKDTGNELVSAEDEAALLALPAIRRFVESPPERSAVRDWFYLSDVPPDVIAADEALATTKPGPAGSGAIVPDFARADVARIDVPVFLAFGQHDVSLEPRGEPRFYESAPEITLFLLAGSAHCHNFASTREVLWRRIADWANCVASA